MELVYPLLRHPFIEMFLFGSEVTQVIVHFRQRRRILVDLLVRGCALREDAEAAIHSISDRLCGGLND